MTKYILITKRKLVYPDLKVDIITFHFVNNFGGALQAYALWRVITEKFNMTAEIIDYRNWFIRFTDTVRLFPITTNIGEVKSGLYTMKGRMGRVKKFENFMRHNVVLSKYYSSSRSLHLNPPMADKYICGSDQIWNPVLTFGVAAPYYLNFVKEPERKVAYAPSFGTGTIKAMFIPKISRYLSTFGSLSIREKKGVELLQKITGREAEQLIDPTFLLEKSEWEEIATAPTIQGKYMLLYIMQRDDEIYKHVKKLKEELGLRLVEISRYGYKPPCVDTALVDVGPSEFVGLFRNADYICTNSYHGFVFSLLFEKRFCLIPCKRFRARIYNLAELLGIELKEDNSNFHAADTNYDKQKVIQIIASEKEKALGYLKKNLNGELGY